MKHSPIFDLETGYRTLPQRPMQRRLRAPTLGALTIALMLSLDGAAFAQIKAAPTPAMTASAAKAAADKAKAAHELALEKAKNPVPMPHPLLAAPFNPQVGPQLIAVVEHMHAAAAAAKTPAEVGPALAKIMQVWPQHQKLLQEFDTQLEQIAAHHIIGKKTAEMEKVESAIGAALTTKGQALDAELLRLSKLPLSPKDMAALQNLQKALAG
jgi:hypothetical protein